MRPHSQGGPVKIIAKPTKARTVDVTSMRRHSAVDANCRSRRTPVHLSEEMPRQTAVYLSEEMPEQATLIPTGEDQSYAAACAESATQVGGSAASTSTSGGSAASTRPSQGTDSPTNSLPVSPANSSIPTGSPTNSSLGSSGGLPRWKNLDSSAPDFASRCHKCLAEFELASRARYCLFCGEERIDTRFVTELFHMVVGKRALLRKLDLPKVVRRVANLLVALSGESQRLRWLVTCLETAFDGALREQTEGGKKFSHGITGEYFFSFLLKVAESLDLALRSLLFGLLEQDQDEISRGLWAVSGVARGFPDGTSQHDEGSTSGAGTSPPNVSLADACSRCGSKFLTAANFCHDCGEKQNLQERVLPQSFQIFRGTRALMSPGPHQLPPMPQHEFQQVAHFANKHGFPASEIWRRRIDFLALDQDGDGRLSLDELAGAVREKCNLPSGPIPAHLFSDGWFDGKEGGLDFEAFLIWSLRTENTEHMLVTDPEERVLRRLGRSFGLSPPDVDRVKGVFDAARGTDKGKDLMNEDDFRNAVAIILKIKNPRDVPLTTFRRCWQEASGQQRCPAINFEKFLGWWVKTCVGDI